MSQRLREAIYLMKKGNKYLDFVAGVSACNQGHSNKKITNAIKKQLDKYLHVMVYGEFITEPSLELAKLLAKNLPKNLECTYFTNSGTEALRGVFKTSKKIHGKKKIIAAKNAYHGSNNGSININGFRGKKKTF